MLDKTCKTCHTTKPIAQFSKNKNCAGGHLTECKSCNKVYRLNNAKRRAEVDKQRRRRLGVREKVVFPSDEDRRKAHITATVRWRERNIDKVLSYEQQYRDDNKEHRLKIIKQWRHNHKHRIVAIAAKRKAQLLQATPKWADQSEILKVYEQCQTISTSTGIPHNVDHYYPLQGKTVCGLHIVENLRIIPKQENLNKGNKHPDKFYDPKTC